MLRNIPLPNVPGEDRINSKNPALEEEVEVAGKAGLTSLQSGSLIPDLNFQSDPDMEEPAFLNARRQSRGGLCTSLSLIFFGGKKGCR